MTKLESEGNPFFTRLLAFMPLLVAFVIPFPTRIASIAIAVAAIITIVYGVINKRFSAQMIKRPEVIFILLLAAILVIGLTYSSDPHDGFGDLERFIFPIVFVICVYIWKTSDIIRNTTVWLFAAGCVVMTVVGFVNVFFLMDDASKQLALSSGHLAFTESISIHPTYLSLYFTFIFFFCIEAMRQNRRHYVQVIITLVYSLFMVLYLRSQMSWLVFVIVVAMYFIISLKRRAALVAMALFIAAFLVFLLDSHRIKTVIDTQGRNVSTAVEQRFSVWDGSVKGLSNSPVFGGGTGGEQALINQGYASINYQEGIENSYNAHNQYLQFLSRNGIPELLCFLALFVYAFRQSLKSPGNMFMMFNIMVFFMMFVESFLDVQKGILFFYFFLCLFLVEPNIETKIRLGSMRD